MSASSDLARLGWRGVGLGLATRNFQRGWALGTPLVVDGIIGPKTTAAIRLSLAHLAAGNNTASEHFSFTEFACNCSGSCTEGRIWVHHALIDALEALRGRAYPRGLKIVSGCRCPMRNDEVDGASKSQHLYGLAADIPATTPAATVIALRAFSGVGAQGATSGLVRHVDVRHVDPARNVTRGSVGDPTRWAY